MALSQGRRKLIGRLKSRKTREKEGLVLVEGVRAVGEALDAGVAPRFAVVSPWLGKGADGVRLEERLTGQGLEVVRVDDDTVADLSGTDQPQGVLLVVEEPRRRLDEALDVGRCLVLDGIQDPGNVGTLIRSAVAFSIDSVVALDGTADPWSPKAVRASTGMAFRLPVVTAAWDTVSLMVLGVGPRLLVADGDGEDVRTTGERGTFALVLGNEGAGVRGAIRELAAATISVPMDGPAESLNVAMAGTVLLYELTKETE